MLCVGKGTGLIEETIFDQNLELKMLNNFFLNFKI